MKTHPDDLDMRYLARTLELAREAAEAGEVPVGAVVVREGSVVAEGTNRTRRDCDPSAHAEVVALRRAGAAEGNARLPGTTLYASLEPCAMCAGAIAQARVARVVFAAPDPKGGAVASGVKLFDQPTCHHKPEVAHIDMPQAGEMLRAFFRAKRAK